MGKHSVDILINAKNRSAGVLKKAAMTLGMYFGARAMWSMAKSSVQAFGVQELAVNQLSAALDNLGAGGQAAMADMQQYASSIQSMTTIGDEATLGVMALGASMGGMSGDTLQAATKAAIGFSKSLGMDMKAAMTLVAKAAQGNTQTFTRYGIQLDETLTDQEKFTEVLRRGAEGFKMAQAEADTTSGKLTQLSNAWGDVKESMGAAIAALPGLKSGMESMQHVFANIPAYADIAVQSTYKFFVGMFEDVKYFFGSAIPEYLSWFGRNWKAVFTDWFNFTVNIYKNLWTNIKGFFVNVWASLKGDKADWKWTALTEGFEATMEELPKIAKRHASDLETALSISIAAALDKLSLGAGGDLSTPGAGGLPGGAVAAIGSASKKGPSAQEARFLGGSSLRRDRTAENTSVMAKATLETNRILSRIEPKLGVAAGGSLAPANFS